MPSVCVKGLEQAVALIPADQKVSKRRLQRPPLFFAAPAFIRTASDTLNRRSEILLMPDNNPPRPIQASRPSGGYPAKSAKLNTKATLIVGTGKLRHFGSAFQISYVLAATVPCPNTRLTPEDGVTSPPCSQHRGDVFPEKFNFKMLIAFFSLPFFIRMSRYLMPPSSPARGHRPTSLTPASVKQLIRAGRRSLFRRAAATLSSAIRR